MRPDTNDYAPFYASYVARVSGDDPLQAVLDQRKELEALYAIPEEKGDYAYAEGKWTVKQVLLHMADAERIFAYRALRFGRNDATNLPGFEENDYALTCHAAERTVKDIVDELLAIRTSTELLYRHFTEEDWQRRGLANTYDITVNAIGFITAGHVIHHLGILRERYGL